jgi:hypothetical protein
MNMQLDPHVKAVFDEIIAHAPDIGPTPSAGVVNLDPTVSDRGRRWLAVAAAAVLVVGVAGLVAFAGRDASRSPADEATVTSPPPDSGAGRPLSSMDQLASSDWVVATVLPDGLEYLYARRDSPALGPDRQSRAIAYGVPRGDGTDEELWVEIGRANVGTPDESFTVGEVVWSIERPEDSWWSASTRVGGTDLNVRGSGTFEQVLAGLTVVDDSNLPFTPLGGPDDAVVVARTNVDGDIYTYSIQESGRYKCDWVTSQDGASGGCGSLVQPDADVTIDAGVTTEPGALPGTVDAVRSGSVTAATASVEVVFADGTTVTVEPTDLSGTFDILFWIAAATISTDSQTGLPVTQESVAEVRAYDREGILIGTTIPLGLGQPDEEPSTEEQ